MILSKHFEERSIIQLVNKLRPAKRPKQRVDLGLVQDFADSMNGLKTPLASRCREQVQDYLRDPESSLYVINESLGDGRFLLVSFIRVPKASTSFFEAMVYREVKLDDSLRARYPSTAYPVVVELCTDGLDSEELLGFFPENIAFGTEAQKRHRMAKAVYLIDRFAARYFKYTKKIIAQCTSDDDFSLLRNVHVEYIPAMSAHWLLIHEHGHNSNCLMPYCDFQTVKSSLYGAGFEELRVDLSAIVELYESNQGEDRTIAEMILAERLIAYPMVDLENGKMAPTFDTVGSVYLFVCLIKKGAITTKGSTLKLVDRGIEPVREILQEMIEVERGLLASPASKQRDMLIEHVESVVTSLPAHVDSDSMENGFPIPRFYVEAFNKIQ